jgi:hypothetical protein
MTIITKSRHPEQVENEKVTPPGSPLETFEYEISRNDWRKLARRMASQGRDLARGSFDVSDGGIHLVDGLTEVGQRETYVEGKNRKRSI